MACMPARLPLACSNGIVKQLDHVLAHKPSLKPHPHLHLQILFVIQNPDVFKSPAGDTYIIFGEVGVCLAASKGTFVLRLSSLFLYPGSSSCQGIQDDRGMHQVQQPDMPDIVLTPLSGSVSATPCHSMPPLLSSASPSIPLGSLCLTLVDCVCNPRSTMKAWVTQSIQI